MSLLTSVLSLLKTRGMTRLHIFYASPPLDRSRLTFAGSCLPLAIRGLTGKCSVPAVQSRWSEHSVPPGFEGKRDMPELNLQVIGARPAARSNIVANLPLGTEERTNDTNQY